MLPDNECDMHGELVNHQTLTERHTPGLVKDAFMFNENRKESKTTQLWKTHLKST